MRRVVVTGIGLQTPLGSTPEAVFDAILAGESGVRRMAGWEEVADIETLLGAPVVGFDGKQIPRKFRRTMGRVAQLAVTAALQAVAASGLPEEVLQNGRTAVIAGSTVGSAAAEETFWNHLSASQSARGVKSTLFFHGMSHTVAANIALMLGVVGEVFATNAACASSTQAIGLAADRIRSGHADAALAGGAEELHVASGVIFQALSAVSTGYNDQPELTPRPFDARRDGIVVGEGAGVVVLEELEHAISRGAPIIGEILGFSTTCDARHMANPEPDGMAAAIRSCLGRAGVEGSALDYVNAHATGTIAGDRAEAEALLRTVGDGVPVSSSKGHLGHLLGACGVVETAVCLQALTRGIAPATRNLTDPDVAPIQLLREPLARPIRRVLTTSFAFGGVNAVLLLGAPD